MALTGPDAVLTSGLQSRGVLGVQSKISSNLHFLCRSNFADHGLGPHGDSVCLELWCSIGTIWVSGHPWTWYRPDSELFADCCSDGHRGKGYWYVMPIYSPN